MTIDVDAMIKNTVVNDGWRITDGGSQSTTDTSTFATSDNANSARRPQLVINYEY